MSRLGRYTLLRRLAEGGMGSVYLAEIQGAANFTRKVAIKRVLPHLARDSVFLSKFIDEANLMVQLHHGNIIGVQELADDDGELYIVMDYLPGRDLKAVTRALKAQDRLMPPDLAAWIIAEVCAGLDYAHRKTNEAGEPLRIVHRDVSPSNILLGADGEVKVADFGIARARGGLHKSVTGALQGKFIYMSPEQAEGRSLDARSDVFSAGLILYELLCNARPFAGESETEVLRLVRQGVTRPPRDLNPRVDAGLDAIVMRALRRDPEDRYESAGALRRDLLHHLAAQGSAADAHRLGAFLKLLFPEGVVPEAAPPTPLSMDEALLMQLNALTPSGQRTPSAQGTPSMRSNPALAATLSRPASVSYPTAGVLAPPAMSPFESVSGVAAALPPPSTLRRWLRVGLPAALMSVVIGALLWERPATVELTAELFPPSSVAPRFSLKDGTEIRSGAQLPQGLTWFCAEAEGYPQECGSKNLTGGRNVIALRLRAEERFTLDPEFDPPLKHALVYLNEDTVPTAMPYQFTEKEEGKLIVIRVEAAGYEVSPSSYKWTSFKEQPYFRFIKTPDLGVAERDAGVEPDLGVSGPKRRARRRQGYSVRLESSPKATVKCDGKKLGETPLSVNTTHKARSCVLSAPGYASTTRRFKLRDKRKSVKITLARPILVNIRSEPTAAHLFVDGRGVGVGWAYDLKLAPGEHVFEARWKKKGEDKVRVKRITRSLKEGERATTIQLNVIE